MHNGVPIPVPGTPIPNNVWFVRLKLYNKNARCLRMRWVCTHPKVPKLFVGGDGVKTIPTWYRVNTEQATILSEEKQFQNDPFSPALFDIVDGETKKAIDLRESAARRMIMGMAAPELAEQKAHQTLALAAAAAQHATSQFGQAPSNPFQGTSQLQVPHGTPMPKDESSANVEDLIPETPEEIEQKQQEKEKALQHHHMAPHQELNPQAYLTQEGGQPGLAGVIASNPAAAAELTQMVQQLAGQMAHTIVQKLASTGAIQPKQGPAPIHAVPVFGAPAAPGTTEKAKAGRVAAVEGIDEATQALPTTTEEPTPSAGEAAPSPPPPRSSSPPDLEPLDPGDPSNTAGAEDFNADDGEDIDPTVSFDGTSDAAVEREQNIARQEQAEDVGLAVKAINNSSRTQLLEFAQQQGLNVDKRLGEGKLRDTIRTQMGLDG